MDPAGVGDRLRVRRLRPAAEHPPSTAGSKPATAARHLGDAWRVRPPRVLLSALLDALFPGDCAGCDRPGPLWCDRCAASLLGPGRPAWPTPCPPGLPQPAAVARYDGAVRSALIAYKEQGTLALAAPLGAALSRSLLALPAVPVAGRPLALVPMPSSRARRRERGDDVVARLAREAARRLRGRSRPVRVVPALRVARPVADSAGLTAAQRLANLSGALAVRPAATVRLAGATVLLVDDLITTGATLAEAATTLRRAGVEPAGAAVVAATARRRVRSEQRTAPKGDCRPDRSRGYGAT